MVEKIEGCVGNKEECVVSGSLLLTRLYWAFWRLWLKDAILDNDFVITHITW